MNDILKREQELFENQFCEHNDYGILITKIPVRTPEQYKAFLSASLSRAINKTIEKLEAGLPKEKVGLGKWDGHSVGLRVGFNSALSQVKELINKNKI